MLYSPAALAKTMRVLAYNRAVTALQSKAGASFVDWYKANLKTVLTSGDVLYGTYHSKPAHLMDFVQKQGGDPLAVGWVGEGIGFANSASISLTLPNFVRPGRVQDDKRRLYAGWELSLDEVRLYYSAATLTPLVYLKSADLWMMMPDSKNWPTNGFSAYTLVARAIESRRVNHAPAREWAHVQLPVVDMCTTEKHVRLTGISIGGHIVRDVVQVGKLNTKTLAVWNPAYVDKRRMVGVLPLTFCRPFLVWKAYGRSQNIIGTVVGVVPQHWMRA